MINIIKAGIQDLESLTELFGAYRNFYRMNPDREGENAFLKERLLNNDSQIFIAKNEQDALCGFVQLYPQLSSTQLQEFWLLNDLYVDPAYRGKGISIQLIERSKKLCRETNAFGLVLETEKSNDIGNKLYPRAGFELDEVHNFYIWEIKSPSFSS
ncbi:MAG: GNAT family N-acetyltransferase [Balneolaceae bacterium]